MSTMRRSRRRAEGFTPCANGCGGVAFDGGWCSDCVENERVRRAPRRVTRFEARLAALALMVPS